MRSSTLTNDCVPATYGRVKIDPKFKTRVLINMEECRCQFVGFGGKTLLPIRTNCGIGKGMAADSRPLFPDGNGDGVRRRAR